MSANPYVAEILGELKQAAEQLDDGQAELLASRIGEASKLFVAGAGRSGLMAKAFAMRLAHLGLNAYVVGESVTPPIGERDLLILATGSGETRSLVSMAEKAKSMQAAVATVTIRPESTIGRLADVIVRLPGSPKEQTGSRAATVQPMGSLFEQTLLLFFDGMILRLMERHGHNSAAMFGRHANLE